MVKTKVFVGNLSFKTTEADLRKEFEIAGAVDSANIISRGSRSLGYGFVEMGSLEEANKSVELLHKKLVDQREINVEVARPREDKPQQPRQPRQQGGQNQGQQGGDQSGASNNNDGGDQQGRGRGRFPRRGGRGGGRFRGGRGGQNNGGGDQNNNQGGQNNNQGGQQNNNQGGNNNQGQGGQQGGQRQPRQPRPPRAPRAPRTDQTPRTPSKTTLYVSNLPFSIDDAKLSEIFAGMNVKEAHVVRKPNDRSKGFGFVEFSNEEDQVKALNATSGKKNVEGRDLTIKIALTELPKPEGGAAGANNGTAAGAGASAGVQAQPLAATQTPAASGNTSAPTTEQK